jgi:hypothetical protein
MTVALLINVGLWLAATVTTWMMVSRWSRKYWTPTVVGLIPVGDGPYRSGLPVPLLRHGAPPLVSIAAVVAIATFWAFGPVGAVDGQLTGSTELAVSWAALASVPLAAALLMLRAEVRGSIAFFVVAWLALAISVASCAIPAMAFFQTDRSLLVGVAATGPVLLLVVVAALTAGRRR